MSAPKIPKADIRAFCEKTREEPENAEKFFRTRSYGDGRIFTLKEALERYENDYDVKKRRSRQKAAREKLVSIFAKFAAKSDDEEALYEDSLEAFYKAIGVDPNDNKTTLGLVWQMRGTTLGELRRDEFLEGFSYLLCENIGDLTTLARATPSEVDQHMKKFYNYLFTLAKANQADKTANTEYALDLWAVVLPMVPNFTSHTHFLDFIREKNPPHISRDLWQCVYDFAQHVRDDYSRHDEGDSWNSTIDEFAAWMKLRQA